MKTYQEKVDNLLEEQIEPTKISLTYEINCIFDCWCDDELIDMIYQAYLDNGNYFFITDFVLAIKVWCEANETDFDLIDDYEKMLSEIF